MEQIVDLSRTTVAVVAHCDDLELGAGGTVARLCDDGWVVHVLILCSQQMTPERTADEVAQMAALRERESMVGARVLGITSENLHFFRLANFSDTRNTVGKIHQKCEQLFGSKKPALPFVLTHTVNDQHPDHRKSFEIASAAFRVPLLCMLVASSTANRFNPIIGVDISTTFERKLAAFKAHESQQTLQAGLGGLMVERLRDIDAQEQRRVGFKYGEFFELVYLYADRENVASFIPVARLCDSRPHFEKLIDQLGGDDQYLKVNARQVLEREAPALHNGRTGFDTGGDLRCRLGPNAGLRAALRSGRFPIGLAYTAIDGCAEILASPSEESRYAGLFEQDVRCTFEDTIWDPEVASSRPREVRRRMIAALHRWRKQSAYPRRLRTLLRSPAEPVTDRRCLELEFGTSDYFTVRTVTELSRSEPFELGVGTLFPSKNWWANSHHLFQNDVPPYHVSVQAVVLNRTPSNGEFGLLLTSYNPASSPIAPGVSVTMAEQMAAPTTGNQQKPWWWETGVSTMLREQDGDIHIFDTLRRGLWEELGLRAHDYDDPILLNACLEAEMFFVTFIFVVLTRCELGDIFGRWQRAPDRQESALLAHYPLGRGEGTVPPFEALKAVIRLMEEDQVDLGPYLLPRPGTLSNFPPQPWHPAARMRLYAAAKHWWNTEVDRFVELDVELPAIEA